MFRNGVVEFAYSAIPHQALLDKCQEMRKELRRIEHVVGVLENQARLKAPIDAIKPNMSTLYWWHVSLLETFFSMTKGVLGDDMADKVFKDLRLRFKLIDR